MADEYKEIAETNDTGKSKKKKIIIGVVAAVIVVAIVAVVCALTLGGGKEEYTDTPVSGEVTTELEPGVENGAFVDSVPNIDENSGNSAQGSDGSGSSSGSQNSGSASSGNSNSSSNSGSSNNSSSSGNSGSSDDSGSSNSGSDENVARKMDVYIVLPNDGNIEDKLFIYINGELVNEDEEGLSVKLNGQPYHFITSESYTGSVTVEARLQNYGTKETRVSNNTQSQIIVSLPLDSSEENHAPAI